MAELERLVEEIRRDRQAAADAGRWHAVAPLWSAELRVRQLIEQVEATPRERSIEEILGGKG